ncbi:TetR/AcrR family transcriptional regulator [Cellulomonas hominis]|uniref:TetR/AcrR family transcriptional regulator n=1 Tax=Cellulomonas hominis TaxID=156981 RepID=UPI001B8FAAFB|nr:helix-turn-helix domain-containing protein [Cellulomonas hominis]VTR76486.1 putative HTH-type transcriptional regulator [Cellulomonas hominis]
MDEQHPTGDLDPVARRDAEDARRQAEALRRDREKAAQAAAKEAARAERDREKAVREAEKAQREREKAARAAEKDAGRRRAEQDRQVREVEREADRAEREAEKAALDARLAAQRAARQVERARLRARAVEEPGPDAPPDLPPGLALLWRPAPVGRRGPRPGLTLAGIAQAAVALADAEGLGAVSMARVAERVGVTTMALYRYVSSKDDLLALMMETALGEAVDAAERAASDLPAAPGVPAWRTALERWCHDQLALAQVHPWSVQAPVTASLPGPARVAFLERGLRALEGTPLTWAERTAVVGHLSLHVLSESQVVAARTTAERAARAAAEAADGDPAPRADEATHPALLDYATVLRAVVDPERHPVLSEAVAAGAFDDTSDEPGEGDDPDLALRMMLDGVAALVERARGRLQDRV